MIWGFAKDFNGYIKQRDLSVPPLNEKLFLAQPILIGLALVLNFFLSVVLVLGVASDASEVLVGAVTVISGLMTIFIGLPLFFIMILIMNQLINGVNGLQEALSAESDSSA